MGHRPPRKLTLVEIMIIMAIAGIFLSMIGSTLSTARKNRTPAGRRSTPRVSTEGHYNTIEQPESRKQRNPEAMPIGGKLLQGLVRIAIIIAIVILLPLFLRRMRLSPRRPPKHRHPPSDDLPDE